MSSRTWTEYTCDREGCGNTSSDEMELRGWIEIGNVYWSGVRNAPKNFCMPVCAILYLENNP